MAQAQVVSADDIEPVGVKSASSALHQHDEVEPISPVVKKTQGGQPPSASARSFTDELRFRASQTREVANQALDMTKAAASRATTGARNLVSGEGGRIKAARDVIEGGGEALAIPAAGMTAVALAANPLDTIGAMGLGYVAQRLVEGGLKKVGASPDAAALGGDIAGLAAPSRLTAPLRGGIANTAETSTRLAADRSLGLNLSVGEAAAGTKTGRVLQTVQRGVGSTVAGGTVQAAERQVSDAKIGRILDGLLATISKPAATETAGKAAEAGLGAAHSGIRVLGQRMETVAKAQSPVDVSDVVTEARRVFVNEISKHLEEFPGLSRGARANIIKARSNIVRGEWTDGDDDVLFGREGLLKAIEEHDQTPLMKVARMVLDAKPETSFEGAAKARTELMKYAGYGQQAKRTPDEGLAAKLGQTLTDKLFTASPEFKNASTQYRLANEKVHHDGLDKLFELSAQYPEKVVSHVGLGDVSTARNLRKSLLDVASLDPNESARGQHGFDAFRTTWFRDQVVRGGGTMTDLEKMGSRLKTASESGVLRELFPDPAGKSLVQNARTLADAVDSRPQAFARSMYLALAAGRLLSGGSILGFAKGEAASGLLTWMLYRPQMKTWFIEGMQAPKGAGAAALRRVGQAYGAYLASQAQSEKGAAQ